jgi:ribonuclease P protein component
MVFVLEWRQKRGAKCLTLAERKVVSALLSDTDMKQGFPKQARILQGTEYSLVLRRPQKKLVEGAVQMKTRDSGCDRARLGLIVPKRGTAKAHDRNRIKRVIRELFRTSQQDLPAKDIVIQVFNKIPANQLRETLTKQFAKLSAGGA